MGFSKIFGHSSKGTEYCRGFIDKHGQWNNGFYCPRWGGPDREYCCGPEDHKYCCPKPEVQEKLHDNQSQHVSLLVGLAVGSLLLLMATIFLSCYFCRCCWGYKRRKGIQAVTGSVPPPRVLRAARQNTDYRVHYSVCPHGALLSEYMLPAPSYPADDPPPYPGGPAIPLTEKTSIQQYELSPGYTDLGSHQVAWQQNVVITASAESEKSSTSSAVDASPLPIKASDTYPLLQTITDDGLAVGDPEKRRREEHDKRSSVCSDGSSYPDQIPGTSWGYETWPRAKAPRRSVKDNELNSSYNVSTESTDS